MHRPRPVPRSNDHQVHCILYHHLPAEKRGHFLDIGCYIGQDLRRLVFDGSPSNNLYGIDIVSHWDVGYEMFCDKEKFSAEFIETDILNPNAQLKALGGKIDIVSVAHVLHQWLWEGQVAAAKQINSLVRPGGMVVGFQVGTAGGPSKRHWDGGEKFHSWMMQDPESWREMWELVGKETGTEWRVDGAELKTWEEVGLDPKETAYLGEHARILQFVVTRIQ
jgi:SAM-dependent methyltransferase